MRCAGKTQVLQLGPGWHATIFGWTPLRLTSVRAGVGSKLLPVRAEAARALAQAGRRHHPAMDSSSSSNVSCITITCQGSRPLDTSPSLLRCACHRPALQGLTGMSWSSCHQFRAASTLACHIQTGDLQAKRHCADGIQLRPSAGRQALRLPTRRTTLCTGGAQPANDLLVKFCSACCG